MIVSFDDVLDAKNRIYGRAKVTPILSSEMINDILGAEVYLKCENLQKAGAFKFRGATNAIYHLKSINKKATAVATHSSGNHAQALAKAAKNAGLKAYIVMPNNAPQVKIDAVKAYNGQITFCQPTLQAREETLAKVIEDTGAIFIHPYKNPQVIAGQGTAALEFLDVYPELEIIITPVGGGGLLSGTAISAKSRKPNIEVIGAEPLGADDAFRSFHSGEWQPSVNPKTICDGLLTSLGEPNFEIIRALVDDIMVCKEETIIEMMRLVWERMKIVIEPSSAVTLAIIKDNPERFKNKVVGAIISGGNVDLAKLPWL